MKATIKKVKDKINKHLLNEDKAGDNEEMCDKIKQGDWFRTYAELGPGKMTGKPPAFKMDTINNEESFEKFFGDGAEDKGKWKVLEEEYKMSKDGE